MKKSFSFLAACCCLIMMLCVSSISPPRAHASPPSTTAVITTAKVYQHEKVALCEIPLGISSCSNTQICFCLHSATLNITPLSAVTITDKAAKVAVVKTSDDMMTMTQALGQRRTAKILSIQCQIASIAVTSSNHPEPVEVGSRLS